MVDVEKVKKFLLEDLKDIDLSKEFDDKVGNDIFSAMYSYSIMIANGVKQSVVPFEDKITGALFIGYLLRDFIITEELRERFENSYKDDKNAFISYEEFVNRFSKVDCFEMERILLKDCNLKGTFDCTNIKCMSIQCYNKFREAYYGE